MDFDSFVNDIERNGWNVFGTEVYESGRLIHSWGDNQASSYNVTARSSFQSRGG